MIPTEFQDALHGMVESLNKKLVHIAETTTHMGDRYYIIVFARQDPPGSRTIRQFVWLTKIKPPMLLATMVYCVDRQRGELSRLWALPGDWLQYPAKDLPEPHPEIIAAKKEVGEHYYRYT